MSFAEIKVFKVKSDKVESFESIIHRMIIEQKSQIGAINIRYVKRFYTIDGIESGMPPRELTKIVKCVKYYSYWEFDNKYNYGKAIEWFLTFYYNDIQQLLIMPFDINIGDIIE